MNKFVAILVLATMAAMSNARPGGYLAKGGVYDFKRPLSYLDEAVNAGKIAWEQKIVGEAESGLFEEDRGARQAASYVPVFFTSAQDAAPIVHSAQQYPTFASSYPGYTRQAREAYQQPIYYQSYQA